MPSHEVCIFQKTLLDLFINKRKKQLLRNKMGVNGLKVNANKKSSMELCLFELFNSHYCSYDKNTRPKKECTLPLLRQSDMFNEFTSHDFCHVSGFWPDPFYEITDAMTLMPPKNFHEINSHCYDKKVVFLLVFRRWRKADTWDDAKKEFRRHRSWCMSMHHALFYH